MFSNSQTGQKAHSPGELAGPQATQLLSRPPLGQSLTKRERSPEEMIPSEARRFSLLIVEDDRDFCYDLFDYFETLGFDVTGTHDERTAGHLLATGNHDVVILNLDMPYRMGLTLLQEARQHQRDLQSILLTERRIDSQLVTRARAAGCVKLFSKPIDHETLHHVVMRCRGEHLSPHQTGWTNTSTSNHDGNHAGGNRRKYGMPDTTSGIQDGLLGNG